MTQGTGTREIPRRLGVNCNTARTHVQRILEKTGARRQAEFACLLLAATPSVRLQ
jgi:DNA-binding CsgD family transcriptional regulator